jgi:hypothetical protein
MRDDGDVGGDCLMLFITTLDTNKYEYEMKEIDDG